METLMVESKGIVLICEHASVNERLFRSGKEWARDFPWLAVTAPLHIGMVITRAQS